jgi:hypothetical protein
MQLTGYYSKAKGLSDKMKEGIGKGEKPSDKPGEKPGNKPGESSEKGQSKGTKPGEGSGGGGQQNGDGEENAKELMEVYKEQRKLREQLQNMLEKQGLTPDGKRVLDQMKDAEKQLLNKGFKNEVLQRMLNIKYEMLKLEKALQSQGEDSQRESQTNKNNYTNNPAAINPQLQEYLNSIEILNRQSLPLRSNFNQKVQEYFKTND